MGFGEFLAAYEELVAKARANKLTADDFAGTTVSLTNPGGIGTEHSVPRLMQRPGLHHRRRRARSTRPSTAGRPSKTAGRPGHRQDHHAHLAPTTTASSRAPAPASSSRSCTSCSSASTASTRRSSPRCASRTTRSAGARTSASTSPTTSSKTAPRAGADQLLPRARPPDGRHRPARIPRSASHPDLDIDKPRPHLLGPRPRVRHRRLRRPAQREAARHPRHAARLVLPHGRHRVHAHPGPGAAAVDPGPASSGRTPSPATTSRCASWPSSTRPRRSRPSCRPSTSARSGSASRAASPPSRCWMPSCRAPRTQSSTRSSIGMAHRGRLNVLTNIAGKTYGQIFREFEGTQDPRTVQGSGDVKYHLGTEGTFTAANGEQMPVYLAANPSHLEAVDGVLEGIVRAKQDRKPIGSFRVLPDHGARRRGDGRPGRRGRDPADVAAARLPHRRHHPRQHQQPGRLHHARRARAARRCTPPMSPRPSRRRSST